MRRELSAREIAGLDGSIDLFGPFAPYIESVVVIDPDDPAVTPSGAEVPSRRYEFGVNGVTGTFCAESFGVKLTQTDPESCVIEWSVRLRNDQYWSLGMTRRVGALTDPDMLHFACRRGANMATSWGAAFRDVVPTAEMADAARGLAEAARAITGGLQRLEETARATSGLEALEESAHAVTGGVQALETYAEAFEHVTALLKPVKAVKLYANPADIPNLDAEVTLDSNDSTQAPRSFAPEASSTGASTSPWLDDSADQAGALPHDSELYPGAPQPAPPQDPSPEQEPRAPGDGGRW